jgi:hypothetical protein
MPELGPSGSVRGAPSNGRLYRDLALLWQKKRFRRCHQQRWKRSEFAQLLEIPRKNVKFCQGSAKACYGMHTIYLDSSQSTDSFCL